MILVALGFDDSNWVPTRAPLRLRSEVSQDQVLEAMQQALLGEMSLSLPLPAAGLVFSGRV